MAYSQNPFSVASFGESYEQADASFAITGVQGTGVIDSGIAVAILTVVDLATTSVQATAATNTVTVVAKAVVVPTGVSATGTADDGLTFITGTGATPTIPTPTAFTGSINGAGITLVTGTGAVIEPVGFGLEIITDSILVDGDEVVIDADANVDLTGKGVQGTTALNGNNVVVVAKALVLPVGVQGTFTVGDETINAVQFDYESIKTNYSRDRTAYIGEYSTLGNTVYVRAA